MEPLVDEEEGLEELVKDWVRQKPSAIKQVNRLLASADLTMDAVIAHTLCENLESFERIERMIAMSERRRDAVLGEIDRHRATLGHALRRTVEQIDQGGYRVLDAKSQGNNAQ